MNVRQIHEVAPSWLIFRDGCPDGEAPEQVGARVDRMIARSRAVDGDIALSARGHVPLPRGSGLRRAAASIFCWIRYLVCPRLLSRDTGCADLEWASHRLARDERDYAMIDSKGRDVLW